MHQCLEIDEIVVAVSSFLSGKDLLSLALTCQHFKEPALSHLWRHMTDLMPFLHLFPQDAVYKPGELLKKGVIWREDSPMTLKRPLLPEDWLLISPYTSYVRRLILKCDRVQKFQTGLLHSAVEVFGGSHVFPGLQKLYVFDSAQTYSPFINILLSPYLTNLSLDLETSPAVFAMLTQLGTACPAMISFRCACIMKDPNGEDRHVLAQSLSQAVVGWTKIRQLNVSGVGVRALNHLSQLDNLEEISFHENIRYKTVPIGFRSLRKFESLSWPFDLIIEFLRASQTPHLQILRVTIATYPEATQWQTFFHLIGDHSSAAEALGISVAPKPFAPPASGYPFLLEASMLRPLLIAGNLHTLDLPNVYHFVLTDDFIEELAMASPALVELNIGTAHATELHPTLTLDAYRYVFEYCPKVSTLGLVVDTTGARKAQPPNSEQKPLKRGGDFTLFVGDTKPVNPVAIAVFLSIYFDQPIREWHPAKCIAFHHINQWIDVFNRLLPALIRGGLPSTIAPTMQSLVYCQRCNGLH